jgi:hypothetical protein
MKVLKLDREKYLKIARTQGAQTALTQLHKDTEKWEYQTFEGQQGYQPELFTDLIEVRNFSRELWEMALATSVDSTPRNS